jgi:hypothetical protein
VTQSASSSFILGIGFSVLLQNHLLDASSLTVSYTITGAPASISIVVEGIVLANGGASTVLDTYSSTSNTSGRSINLTATFDWFRVTVNGAGGQNVSVSGSLASSGSGPTFSAAQSLVNVHTL